ncbi:MAG: helix-hairpin-helix domain-containing protein, partial [Bacteroidota bacterium]
ATLSNEDLTKVYGLGATMAEQLQQAGVETYEALAAIDLDRLREIIEADGTDQESVNEETWAAQARFLADGDLDGLDEYVEGLREADGNTVDTEPEAAPEAEADAAPEADSAPEAEASDAPEAEADAEAEDAPEADEAPEADADDEPTA